MTLFNTIREVFPDAPENVIQGLTNRNAAFDTMDYRFYAETVNAQLAHARESMDDQSIAHEVRVAIHTWVLATEMLISLGNRYDEATFKTPTV